MPKNDIVRGQAELRIPWAFGEYAGLIYAWEQKGGITKYTLDPAGRDFNGPFTVVEIQTQPKELTKDDLKNTLRYLVDQAKQKFTYFSKDVVRGLDLCINEVSINQRPKD